MWMKGASTQTLLVERSWRRNVSAGNLKADGFQNRVTDLN